jgi:DNA polymerase/3'-5' exonuclease PolX
MFIRDAKAIADNLVKLMQPHCERIEIAGSIRRGLQIVKDIEIVAIPRWETATEHDLFGTVEKPGKNLLHKWALEEASSARVQWIKPGTSEIVPWMPKPDGKYWRGLVDRKIKLDLFLTTPAQWGIILLIRTGSAEFSQGVMTYAKQRTSYHIEGGALRDRHERVLETFEERDAFDALHLDYVEPRDRAGFQAVKKNGIPQFQPGYGIARMEVMR